MVNEKWYVVENIGVDAEVSIVKLTEEEAKAVRKFLNTQKVVVSATYGGCAQFYNKPYDTIEDAKESIKSRDYYNTIEAD